MSGVALVVLAKAPAPGRVKTRLCPPCTPAQAAAVAEAALADTLATVAATGVDRRVCVLDGSPGAWLPPGFPVRRQRPGGLDRRIAGALADVGGPALLIGMDTPQLRVADLRHAIATLEDHDAALGPTDDGGYWAIGLRRPDDALLHGVPMSTDGTHRAQLRRLERAGLRVARLPRQRDVDHLADAHAIRDRCSPSGRFVAALRQLDLELAGAPAAA